MIVVGSVSRIISGADIAKSPANFLVSAHNLQCGRMISHIAGLKELSPAKTGIYAISL